MDYTVDDLAEMTCYEVVEWLKSVKFGHEDVFEAIEECDLDGEALISAANFGPDALKEAIPSLGKRLRLLATIKNKLTPRTSALIVEKQRTALDDRDVTKDGDNSDDNCKDFHINEASAASTKDLLSFNTSPKALRLETFTIPSFKAATMKNLQLKSITDQDRKHIVRTLATVVMSFSPHPTTEDCGVAAKALVAKYSFLADTMGKPHHSWMKFIATRCANLNRDSSMEPHPKKNKTSSTSSGSKHEYGIIPPCDEITFKRNIVKIETELAKPNPISEVLIDAMNQTYPNRRTKILDENPSVSSVCMEYSLLKSPGYITREFDMIVQQKESYQSFHNAWLTKWVPSILAVADADGIQYHESNMQEMEDLPEEYVTQAAFRALVKMLVPVQRGGKGSSAKGSGASNTSKKIPTLHNLLFTVKRGTPSTEINPPHNHPIIVVMKDIDDSSLDRFYIMVENVTMNDTADFTQALFMLLAVHYIFNLEYNSRVKEPLYFLQEFVARVKDTSVKHSAHFTSVCSRITSCAAQNQ